MPHRGDLWLAQADKIRPVVVMHRDSAARVLNSVLVVPLTSTIRSIPTEVGLGPADGLDRDCVASLDNMTLIVKTDLLRRIGRLTDERMAELCAALAVAVRCG